MARFLVMALLLCGCPGTDEPPADTGDTAPEPGPWDEPFAWVLDHPAPCPAPVPEGDLLVELLDQMGLGLDIGIGEWIYQAYGGSVESDRARLSHFHRLQQDLTELPCFAGNQALRADSALEGDHPIATTVADAGASLDLDLTVGGPLAVPAEAEAPLVEVLDRLNEGVEWDRDGAVAAADAVPLELRRAAAILLLAAADAAEMRDAGLGELVSSDRDRRTVFDRAPNSWLVTTARGLDPDHEDFHDLFTAGTSGQATLVAGGVRLARALDETDWASLAGAGGAFSFRASTPLGEVVLSGTGDDVYDPGSDPSWDTPILLLVDTGGRDTYRVPAGANTSYDQPVALHVDLGGDDLYGYVEVGSPHDAEGLLPADAGGRYPGDDYYGPLSLSDTARQGAGRAGYGFLLDLGGSADTYRSLRMSQGFASVGVGVLWDDGGDDTYQAEAGAQGSAVLGVAVLHDGGGDDTYRALHNAQGFGWVGSYGILYEAGGDDDYELVVDDPVVFYSPQQPGSANSSLGQGTAFGWRRDSTGTHLSGGLALLRDRAGHDTYRGSVFVQGAGYWMGMGILADAAGNDTYDGLFYAQAAGAHFALAALLDGGGDDVHDGGIDPSSSSIGLGHDFSVVVLVDEGGSDAWYGPDRSIGAGKCHGLGLLVETGGDDLYQPEHDRSIGWATDYDWAPGTCGDYTTVPTWGLFVDAGGTDSYDKPDPTGYGDDTTWINDDPDDDDALEHGGGIDAEGTTFAHAYGATWEGG